MVTTNGYSMPTMTSDHVNNTSPRLLACHHCRISDLCIEGAAYDFLALVSCEEDPDTLAFQRRLVANPLFEQVIQLSGNLHGIFLSVCCAAIEQ